MDGSDTYLVVTWIRKVIDDLTGEIASSNNERERK